MLSHKGKPFRERRRHPRVDDDIVLMCRQVKAEEVPEKLTHEENPPFLFPLASQLNLLGLEANYSFKSIEETHPVLAEYLKSLERRIDILARAISVMEEISNHPTQFVNLSASGLAFVAEKRYPIGVLLELKMILPITLHCIMAYGRVVDSSPNDNDGLVSYSTGVEFIRLKDDDRERLIRHVARRRALFRKTPPSSY